MKYELAIAALLTFLLVTVFSPSPIWGILLFLSVMAAPWEALFGKDQPAGNVDETKVVGFRIYYANGTTSEGTTFLEWTLKSSTNVVAVVFFLFDQWQDENLNRWNYTKVWAHETNFWFVDGLTYGGGSTLPLGLPLGAAKSGASMPAEGDTAEEANRMEIYNSANSDKSVPV